MEKDIKKIEILKEIGNSDGDVVYPGIYELFSITYPCGKIEEEVFYLKGLDGPCIEKTNLYFLQSQEVLKII
jgi:hypothetical protein